MASPCTRSCFKSELGERDPMQEALAEIERLKDTIRAFGRGDIVPITDKDAEIERLRAGLDAAIRAAKLALFVINKQGVMPNSSWESGFNSDLKKATDALGVEQRWNQK